MKKTSKKNSNNKTITLNRKARFNYAIEEKIEAGIVLLGSEIKSLRTTGANISEAYVSHKNNEIVLINSNIDEYKFSHYRNHHPRRERKLLLNRREINKIIGLITRKGYSALPTCMYFNNRGKAKVEIGLGKGKNKIDKRLDEKDRQWKRDKARLLKPS